MMMFGMFWVGLLILLLVIAVPILFVILIVGGGSGILQRWTHQSEANRSDKPVYTPMQQVNKVEPAAQICSHCGTGLQAGWTHCPQCGSPIE